MAPTSMGSGPSPRSRKGTVTRDGIEDLDEDGEVLLAKGQIASYGADYPVDGLVKRLEEGDITIPTFDPAVVPSPVKGFQRKYVWSKRQADRFVESLLLGFPVPGIFLVKQPSGILLVLDGAQRLETLRQFVRGGFRRRNFVLDEVQDQWVGLSYKTLDPRDRRRFDDSIIHATVVRQEDAADLNAIYMIFERLNTGGTLLQPQEIRVALFHGKLVEELRGMNNDNSWRRLVGKRSQHLKDQELILRVFAMVDNGQQYRRPMKEFLNRYLEANRNPQSRKNYRKIFADATDYVLANIGDEAFRLVTVVNAAIADSVLSAVIRQMENNSLCPGAAAAKRHRRLMDDKEYLEAVTRATADEKSVKTRLRLAFEAFRS